MKRVEEMADSLLSLLTLPIRVTIGIFNAVEKNTPEDLEMPFEIKRKKGKND